MTFVRKTLALWVGRQTVSLLKWIDFSKKIIQPHHRQVHNIFQNCIKQHDSTMLPSRGMVMTIRTSSQCRANSGDVFTCLAAETPASWRAFNWLHSFMFHSKQGIVVSDFLIKMVVSFTKWIGRVMGASRESDSLIHIYSHLFVFQTTFLLSYFKKYDLCHLYLQPC